MKVIFKQVDADQNGVLDLDEFFNMMEAVALASRADVSSTTKEPVAMSAVRGGVYIRTTR